MREQLFVLFRAAIAISLLLPTNTLADRLMVFTGIQNAVNSKISLDILKSAYHNLGIEIRYLPLPGERALRTSNSGEVDGEVFRIAKVDKRYPNLIPVPTSINVLQGTVFTKRHVFEVDGWKSLAPYKIGIQVGIKFVERGTKGMKRIVVDSNEQLFKMLDNDRVDIIVVAYTNGLKTLSSLKLKGIRALTPAVEEYALYHYLHKKNRDLIPKIDAQLKAMKKSGTIDLVRQQYLQKLRRQF